MPRVVELLLLLVILTSFIVLGTTRLSTCIRAVALQGLLLGLLPLALYPGGSLHIWGLAGGTVLLKGVILPRFLRWAIREAAVRREVEPRVGFALSLLVGVVAVAAAFAISRILPLPEREAMLSPVALPPRSSAVRDDDGSRRCSRSSDTSSSRWLPVRPTP
jgi:hydrogenase-4 component E